MAQFTLSKSWRDLVPAQIFLDWLTICWKIKKYSWCEKHLPTIGVTSTFRPRGAFCANYHKSYSEKKIYDSMAWRRQDNYNVVRRAWKVKLYNRPIALGAWRVLRRTEETVLTATVLDHSSADFLCSSSGVSSPLASSVDVSLFRAKRGFMNGRCGGCEWRANTKKSHQVRQEVDSYKEGRTIFIDVDIGSTTVTVTLPGSIWQNIASFKLMLLC